MRTVVSEQSVALDWGGIPVFRVITFLAAGPASERSRSAPEGAAAGNCSAYPPDHKVIALQRGNIGRNWAAKIAGKSPTTRGPSMTNERPFPKWGMYAATWFCVTAGPGRRDAMPPAACIGHAIQTKRLKGKRLRGRSD